MNLYYKTDACNIICKVLVVTWYARNTPFAPEMTLFCVYSWLSSVLGNGNELKNSVRKTNKCPSARMTNDKRKDFQVFGGKGKIDPVRVITAERLELRFWHSQNPERKESWPPEKAFPGAEGAWQVQERPEGAPAEGRRAEEEGGPCRISQNVVKTLSLS